MEKREENRDLNRELLKKLREETGMNKKEFSEYFEIPYRTLQDWENGNRSMPDYLLRLMTYKVKMERAMKKGADKNEKRKKD